MKLIGIGAFTAFAALGLAVADRAVDGEAAIANNYPSGCTVRVNGVPAPLPRAALTIENRRIEPVHAWVLPRHGLAGRDLGPIGRGESRAVAHALPAGRNLLIAKDGKGETIRIVLTVINRGPGTCQRRYLWRIG